MSLFIKDTSVVPQPDGWKYHVAATNHDVATRNFNLFYPAILEHCKANNVQPPSEQDVIDAACKELWIECFESETKQPLINKWTMNVPRPAPVGCCGR